MSIQNTELYGLEPAAAVITEFPGVAVMPFLQQMAVPCPIICVRWAARRKGGNWPWNTGNGRKLPNPPSGKLFNHSCFIKDISSQKEPISIFLIFPEMILSVVFKNTWDNKLCIYVLDDRYLMLNFCMHYLFFWYNWKNPFLRILYCYFFGFVCGVFLLQMAPLRWV